MIVPPGHVIHMEPMPETIPAKQETEALAARRLLDELSISRVPRPECAGIWELVARGKQVWLKYLCPVCGAELQSPQNPHAERETARLQKKGPLPTCGHVTGVAFTLAVGWRDDVPSTEKGAAA